MKANTKHTYVDSEAIKTFAVLPLLIQKLRNEETIYLYNLLLISLVYCEGKRTFRPMTRYEMYALFQGFKLTVTNVLNLCMQKGYIEDVRPNNGAKRGRMAAHKYICTLKGELLLKKYEKVLKDLYDCY